MKRSAMLDEIGIYLATDGVVLDSAVSLDEMAEDILNIIEDNDMRLTKSVQKLDGKVRRVVEWESEDEEK